MKSYLMAWLIAPVLALSIALSGCSKSEQTEAPPPPRQPTAPALPKPPPPPTAKAPALPPVPAPPTPPPAQVPADPYAKLLAAFQSADAGTQASVKDAVAAMKAGKYADAATQFQKLLAQANLTPEQQQMLKDMLAQAQKQAVASTAQQAVSEVQKAVPEAPKALPLGQ